MTTTNCNWMKKEKGKVNKRRTKRKNKKKEKQREKKQRKKKKRKKEKKVNQCDKNKKLFYKCGSFLSFFRVAASCILYILYL